MTSDILWSLVLGVCIFFGLRSPYIALYAVIFTDIFKPQQLSYGFLSGKPLSMILTVALLASLIINVRKLVKPSVFGVTVLLIMFIGWLTYTTSIAQFPGPAWFKYDYVIKTIIMTLTIPFVLNTRLKVEMAICAIVAGVSYYVIVGGMRTALGQAGYGMPLVPTPLGDSEIVETSTLSMVAVFTIPMLLYIRNHSLFRDRIPFLKHLALFLVACCLLTVIGTYARTGLIGLFVLLFLYFLTSQHKIKIALGCMVLLGGMFMWASDSYVSRMQTLENATEESSALGRILVWRWTIDYVSERPITGGGFDSYIANAGELNQYLESDVNVSLKPNQPKAFHNIFFEVLGEQGYVGLFIYLILIFWAWKLNWRLSRDKNADPALRALAITLQYALIIYCVCGMFIGVAYAPWVFYFIGISSGLQNVFPAINKRESRRLRQSIRS
ncbi:putative O-glycosylation ligase, exosortase A system-associated [Marinobacter sp.]|uniref:putative O-glycosylation ligase, exosortase A system-associated n=1 Tax=Marinobacter sp. TaxID=50741 RepID=UPI003A92CAF9